MALRSFTDSTGHEWRVWNIVPQYGTGSDDDTLTPGLEGGWLCFENEGDKRRLCPIPEDWETADPAQLERYCGQAKAVKRRSLV